MSGDLTARHHPLVGLTAVLAFSSLPAVAQNEMSYFWNRDCPEETSSNPSQCPFRAKSDGWVLKYNSTTPPDLADVDWNWYIWQRDKHVVLCVERGGYGGVRLRDCKFMNEVQRP